MNAIADKIDWTANKIEWVLAKGTVIVPLLRKIASTLRSD
jgi:hypothetical protein